MTDLPRIVNKTEAARRLGISTTTFTLLMAKSGAPSPVHNNLWDYKAIELFLDTKGDIKQESADILEILKQRRQNNGDGQNDVRR